MKALALSKPCHPNQKSKELRTLLRGFLPQSPCRIGPALPLGRTPLGELATKFQQDVMVAMAILQAGTAANRSSTRGKRRKVVDQRVELRMHNVEQRVAKNESRIDELEIQTKLSMEQMRVVRGCGHGGCPGDREPVRKLQVEREPRASTMSCEPPFQADPAAQRSFRSQGGGIGWRAGRGGVSRAGLGTWISDRTRQMVLQNRPQAYINGANMGWYCAGCWIRNLEDNGFPTPAGTKLADIIRAHEQQTSGTGNDRASVLPSLGLLPLGYGCNPLADTRQLDDLLMEPTGMKIPECANTTIPVLRIRDDRFGIKAAQTRTYSARCDTCPQGAPLLVWDPGSPPLGCFIWKPAEDIGSMDRCPLDSHCWAASYRDPGSVALWGLPGFTVSFRLCSPSIWTELLRHCILLLRLQRPYPGAGRAATSGAMGQLCSSCSPSVLDGGVWQTYCWIFVGWALAVEVFTSVIVQGVHNMFRSFWSMLDATILLLTATSWMLAHPRGFTAPTAREVDEIEGADLALLALRFALQLGRVFAAWHCLGKVTQMQSSFIDIPDVQMQV
ncbi:unnamed protein product [Prorocentrum cordatum]|uniref:Ion transport domain-containing protein n=1 Tax=Prorocentrum cordatum TaxID=2364126 RepID=A0ABN9UCF2_9DINO|nr:unnamed protein product [Polarella glacialis]